MYICGLDQNVGPEGSTSGTELKRQTQDSYKGLALASRKRAKASIASNPALLALGFGLGRTLRDLLRVMVMHSVPQLGLLGAALPGVHGLRCDVLLAVRALSGERPLLRGSTLATAGGTSGELATC